jgi:hypothetical protein
VSLQPVADGLLLTGDPFQMAEDWELRDLGRGRFLLETVHKLNGMRGDSSGFGLLNHSSYVALLKGLVREGFEGVVSLDLGDSVKRLYFRQGELIFAASNQMDDRLGEVLYRAGWITLDQLTEAAVQVNRQTKFGKVLLESQVFSSSQLWDALKLQVLSIFQSTLLHEKVYLQIEAEPQAAPTAVALDDATEHIIDDGLGYAEMVRRFCEKLQPNVGIEKIQATCHRLKLSLGTFVGDVVELASGHNTIQGFLEHSKLTQMTTLCALFDAVHRRVLQLEGFDPDLRGLRGKDTVREIKSIIDAYHHILGEAKKAFTEEDLSFPVVELELFLDQQYRYRRSPVFVLPDGTIAPEAVVSIYAKARTSRRQSEAMTRQLQGLILFLLQIVGDLLPGGKGWELKKTLLVMIT